MIENVDRSRALPPAGLQPFLMFLALVVLDQLIVVRLDHWVYAWPGRTPPYVFPLWASLPRLAVYFLFGYAGWRVLRLNTRGALVFLGAVLAYFFAFRYGRYFVYGGAYSYLVAYLPVASVPGGFLLGYFIARTAHRNIRPGPDGRRRSA